MDGWQKTVLQALALLTAVAALPGGLVLVAYAIRNDFFPYLLDTIPVAKLGFVSLVVVFVFAAGLSVGICASLWLVALLANRSDIRQGRHILLPHEGVERRVLICGSVLIFVLLGAALAINLLGTGNHERAYVGLYFLVVGFLIAVIVDPADGRVETVARLLQLAAIVPFIMLPVLQIAYAPLLNLWMSTMGFRSGPGEFVLVDEDAHRQMADLAAPYGGEPDACAMSIGPHGMWYLRHGAVVWTGLGTDTLVATGQAGMPPLRLDPAQVLTLPRQGAVLCR